MNFYKLTNGKGWTFHTFNEVGVVYCKDVAECFEAMDKLRNPGMVGYFHINGRTYEMK